MPTGEEEELPANEGQMIRAGEESYTGNVALWSLTPGSTYNAYVMTTDENGNFKQAEMTSCGLNGYPLKGEGRYKARIACNLWSKDGTGRYDCGNPKKRYADHPYFTQDGKDGDQEARQYIANMRDGSVAGFKYFDLSQTSEITIFVRGDAKGIISICGGIKERKRFAEIIVDCRDGGWESYSIRIRSREKKRRSISNLVEREKWILRNLL